MRIRNIKVHNFMAIKDLNLRDLGNTIVIAGPNGCGKSSIFHAIRLLKSAYGGYQNNELNQWFSEFQLNVRNNADVIRLLGDPQKDAVISIDFQLGSDCQSFFQNEGHSIVEDFAFRHIISDMQNVNPNDDRTVLIREYGDEQTIAQTRILSNAIINEIKCGHVGGEITLRRDGRITFKYSHALKLSFSIYDTNKIGVIDYHCASRTFSRENVGGINIANQASGQTYRQHSLYNTTNKYNNVQAEMVGAHLWSLLVKDSPIPDSYFKSTSIIDTLKELFALFFPGKSFKGPQPTPDGKITFPVELSDGTQHDINDLSSGEKEILYGYLRLYNLSPATPLFYSTNPNFI